jgi:hypothetical protein
VLWLLALSTWKKFRGIVFELTIGGGSFPPQLSLSISSQ